MTEIYYVSYGMFQWKLEAMKPKSLLRDGNKQKIHSNKQINREKPKGIRISPCANATILGNVNCHLSMDILV
jgi:hypothetical protein